MKVIFEPIKQPARTGIALFCADHIARILYPGIPIEALDGEEACAACACRAALANYPCPRCLVHHNQLAEIDKKFPPQTTQTMQQVYLNSQAAATKTAAEDILRNHGLHATEVYQKFHLSVMHLLTVKFQNAFWELHNSDPYKASSYDSLHSADAGKWGKHLWPLDLDVLGQQGMRATLAIK